MNRRELLTGQEAAAVMFAAMTGGAAQTPRHRAAIAAKVVTWQKRELRRCARRAAR